MRIHPLVSAIIAGISSLWALLLTGIYASLQFLPSTITSSQWFFAVAFTVAMIPAFVIVARVYRRVPIIKISAESSKEENPQ